jgi:hypothetical protein
MQSKEEKLQPSDYEWISKNVVAGKEICEHYGFPLTGQVSSKLLDQVFHAWWNDKNNEKVSDEQIVNYLGCLFGEFLQETFASKWKIATDAFGTDLALDVVMPGHTWEIAPLAFVAKRVQSDVDESGFFYGMESMLLRERN